MTQKIKLMPEGLWTKIAAGEVVERPFSVVKELVENSIDAGATEISIHLEEGGRRLIKVADNGEGISKEDSPFVFERHATSKVSTEDDLLNIRTLGFRGEALPAIAAVSRVTLRTRTEQDASGTRIQAGSHAMPIITDDGCRCGTIVEVKDLFYNTPARLKFLRTKEVEFSRVFDIVKKMAMAYPDIGFRLYNGRKKSLDARKGSLKERLSDIFGNDVSKGLVSLDSREFEGVSVTGFVGRPEFSHPTARCVFTCVNNRPVTDRGINRAIMDGFLGMLQGGRYPFSAININVPTDFVDVNVHPSKSEVRFKKPSLIYDVVKAAVSESLSSSSRGQKPLSCASIGPLGIRPPLRKTPAFYEAREAVAPFDTKPLPMETNGTGVIPDAEIVGQLWGEFLVVEKDKEFWVIDQHGAMERARFERLKRHYYEKKGIGSQRLLMAEKIETTPEEKQSLLEALPVLERLGFEIIPFGPSVQSGGETFLIKAIPDILTGRSNATLIKDLAEEISFHGGSSRVEEKIDSLLMTIACHSVIRGYKILTKEEAGALLREVLAVDFSSNCPHGRPVVWKVTRAELEAFFKR